MSQSSFWADGEPASLCGFVSSNLTWFSDDCSNRRSAYCSKTSNIELWSGNFSWFNASRLCQSQGRDLATITKANRQSVSQAGWIGLHQDASGDWLWIGGHQFNYNNWAPGEPSNADCGSLDPFSGRWSSRSCSQELRFVCHNDNLVMVSENKTWEEAVEHCRGLTAPCDDGPCAHQQQLLSLPDLEDYDYVRERIYSATTDEVGGQAASGS